MNKKLELVLDNQGTDERKSESDTTASVEQERKEFVEPMISVPADMLELTTMFLALSGDGGA